MTIQFRLTILNFLQFFLWGAWLISFGGYMIVTLHFTGTQVGSVYATMGLGSLIMPALLGIIADRWINAERLLGICHLAGAVLMFWASTVSDYHTLYLIMLFNSMMYMPTIALANTVSYSVLETRGFDVVKTFPPIRVWGTVGFIAAMWLVDSMHLVFKAEQLYISSSAALLMGLYSFSIPACPPLKSKEKKNLVSLLGLDAFVLLKNRRLLIFFIFAMFLGAALQITNLFSSTFLEDFRSIYPDSFGVKHPNILISISQMSETLFILTIPFFLRKFGIKKVMLMSMFAWVFRFGLYGIGNPGGGLWLLVMSMIVYGMAFDFFNISGSLFVEREADVKMRASAQGLFMMITNGIGAFIGGTISGMVVDYFSVNGVRDWHGIWFSFAAYALIIGIAFPFVFRYKHDTTMEVRHGH
ncbi:MAG: nucleoside permease [Bacteroidetes bacterium]|nr:nucleoside permease [Bacteroidota bacterium]